MFRFEGDYKGLDDFFLTGRENDLRSNTAIKGRLDRISGLYKDWKYRAFKFPTMEDRLDIQNRCFNSIELMRQAANNFLLAFFDGAIILSSMAVERLLQGILILQGNHFIQWNHKKDPKIEYQFEIPNPIGTGRIIELYGHKGNRLVQYRQMNGIWYYFEIPSLEGSLNKIMGDYKTASLLLADDKERQLSFGEWIFVRRRNTIAHAAFENFQIYEQLNIWNSGGIVNLDLFNRRSEQSFDHYSKATKFIIEVINLFDHNF